MWEGDGTPKRCIPSRIGRDGGALRCDEMDENGIWIYSNSEGASPIWIILEALEENIGSRIYRASGTAYRGGDAPPFSRTMLSSSGLIRSSVIFCSWLAVMFGHTVASNIAQATENRNQKCHPRGSAFLSRILSGIPMRLGCQARRRTWAAEQGVPADASAGSRNNGGQEGCR